MAATQFLCFGDYVLYKGSNTYNINSCQTIEVFLKRIDEFKARKQNKR